MKLLQRRYYSRSTSYVVDELPQMEYVQLDETTLLGHNIPSIGLPTIFRVFNVDRLTKDLASADDDSLEIRMATKDIDNEWFGSCYAIGLREATNDRYVKRKLTEYLYSTYGYGLGSIVESKLIIGTDNHVMYVTEDFMDVVDECVKVGSTRFEMDIEKIYHQLMISRGDSNYKAGYDDKMLNEIKKQAIKDYKAKKKERKRAKKREREKRLEKERIKSMKKYNKKRRMIRNKERGGDHTLKVDVDNVKAPWEQNNVDEGHSNENQ